MMEGEIFASVVFFFMAIFFLSRYLANRVRPAVGGVRVESWPTQKIERDVIAIDLVRDAIFMTFMVTRNPATLKKGEDQQYYIRALSHLEVFTAKEKQQRVLKALHEWAGISFDSNKDMNHE